jgi:hypothetical protein
MGPIFDGPPLETTSMTTSTTPVSTALLANLWSSLALGCLAIHSIGIAAAGEPQPEPDGDREFSAWNDAESERQAKYDAATVDFCPGMLKANLLEVESLILSIRREESEDGLFGDARVFVRETLVDNGADQEIMDRLAAIR